MRYRTLGRTRWPVSEVGYGMWGLAGWTGSDDEESLDALERAVELGCTFFDTAWGYGAGHSEAILGKVVRAHPERTLIVATKVPPENFTWPSRRGFTLDDCFPPEHIREYAHKSLENLGLPAIDLLQFHVWEDAWAADERWQRAIDDLKSEGVIRAVGVSVNRWEPNNVLDTLRTGQIDAVQVIYNVFDQAPEDSLFPLCQSLNVGVIARVPFDEGTFTGTLTRDSRWPEGDWRNTLLRPREPQRQRRPGGGAPATRPGRDDDARACPPLDSRQSGRLDGNPRDAQAAARRGQLRRQRRPAPRPCTPAIAQGPPLGPVADGMVAVRKRQRR